MSFTPASVVRHTRILAFIAPLLLTGCVSEYGHLRLQGSKTPVLVRSHPTCVPNPSGFSSLRVLVSYELAGPLPWAQVHARNLETQATFGPYRTPSDGSLTLPLSPGPWEITLRLDGFIPLRTRLTVPQGSACSLALSLSLQPVHAYVTEGSHPRLPLQPA